MKLLKVAIVAVGLATTSYAFACPEKDKAQAKSEEPSTIAVNDAASLAKSGKVVMVDANSDKTRKAEGVVPGARLLASYKDFDAADLKASKSDTLVFYCYNEQCGAAPSAAKMAKKMGFKAKVMDAGIIGWKKAGHAVKKI